MSHDVRMGQISLTSNFSPTELSALKLAGELSTHSQMLDEIDDWRARCTSVLKKEKHPLVLTGSSAVWAYGLCAEPVKHTASSVSHKRIRMPENIFLLIEERNLRPEDYWLDETNGVTSPLRTITDLLRQEIFSVELELKNISNVMNLFQIDYQLIIQNISGMSSVPYKKQALLRAEKLRNYPSETR